MSKNKLDVDNATPVVPTPVPAFSETDEETKAIEKAYATIGKPTKRVYKLPGGTLVTDF